MRIPIAIVFAIAAQSLVACATNPLPSPSTPMPQGIPAQDPPPGFVSFCLRFVDQCSPDGAAPAIVALDQPTWTLANEVNLHWNASIRPEHDKAHYDRAEYWTIPTDGFGDCKDYALAKRKQLSDLGLPLKALRLAIVETAENERHAVLTIATDKGDYVLDNLTNEILPWNATSYHWIARQEAKGDWDSFSTDNRPTQIASMAFR